MLKKIQRISLIALLCLLAFFAFTVYRMETCGYDCGLFTVASGTATVVYYLVSFWLGLLSFAVLVGTSFYTMLKSRKKC